jgi:hypothetical protein
LGCRSHHNRAHHIQRCNPLVSPRGKEQELGRGKVQARGKVQGRGRDKVQEQGHGRGQGRGHMELAPLPGCGMGAHWLLPRQTRWIFEWRAGKIIDYQTQIV